MSTISGDAESGHSGEEGADASRPILSVFRNPRAPVGMSKYRELLPGTNLKALLMVSLPIIANNLGKIAAAAATTLGIVGYANRERIGRFFADESDKRNQGRTQDLTGVLETAESIKNLHGQLAPDELDRKHTELLEKLTAMNTKTMSDFRVLINEAQSEVITSMGEIEGQLDAQRSETRELREAVADLARRQNAVEQFLHGKDRGEVFAIPGRQRTIETPPRQEETAKRPATTGRRKGNGSTAPEMRAPPDALPCPLADACRGGPRAPGISWPRAALSITSPELPPRRATPRASF